VVTSNALVYELAESEWERTVLEMGPIIAVIWLSLRCGFGIFLIRRAWGCLRRGHALGWLLLGSEFLAIVNGFLQQPTSLGFIVFTTGLCLVAVKSAERDDTLPPEGRVDPRVRQVRP
jgi:hypothetical protein